MNGDAGQDGLRQGLDSMIAIESVLEESLSRFSAEARGYLEAPTVIGELQSPAKGQRESLQAHLRGLAHTDIPPIGSSISAAFEAPPETQRGKQREEAIARLRVLATALSQIAFGYAVLHALAHRSYEVATADLADQHRRNYLEGPLKPSTRRLQMIRLRSCRRPATRAGASAPPAVPGSASAGTSTPTRA